MTQDEIAQFYGVTQAWIWQLMKRMNIEKRNKSRRNQTKENHSSWRKNPSYRTLHQRVMYLRGQPSHCVRCGITDPKIKYEWANISGKYLNHNDFERLCIDCHKKETPRNRDGLGRYSN